MKYNNEQIFFETPPTSNQWICNAVVCFDEMHNSFYVHSDRIDTKGMYLGKVTMIHSIIGDIHKFDVTCIDFKMTDFVFVDIIMPIFKKYCTTHLIELNFDELNYD
jgi:hypothetical protein